MDIIIPVNVQSYVAGDRGMVRSAIAPRFENKGFKNLLRVSSKECNLRNRALKTNVFDEAYLALLEGGMICTSDPEQGRNKARWSDRRANG